MIEFRIDTEPFIEYLHEVEMRFHSMVKTMQKVARIIELATVEYVPLDTSALEQSYEYTYVDNSPFIVLGVGFDAVDEKSGFHYAQYQHDNWFDHPRRGVPQYLTVGIHDAKFEFFELIRQDYLSLFFGGKVASGSVGLNNSMFVGDI